MRKKHYLLLYLIAYITCFAFTLLNFFHVVFTINGTLYLECSIFSDLSDLKFLTLKYRTIWITYLTERHVNCLKAITRILTNLWYYKKV